MMMQQHATELDSRTEREKRDQRQDVEVAEKIYWKTICVSVMVCMFLSIIIL
jgi:hypothetical protein